MTQVSARKGVATACMLAGLITGAACREAAWPEQVLQADGVVIRAPVSLVRTPTAVAGAEGVSHRGGAGGATFELLVVPSVAEGADSLGAARAVMAAAAADGNAPMTFAAHGGMLAVDTVVKRTAGVEMIRVVSQFPRAWLLRLSAPDAAAAEPLFARFAASFHVLEPLPAAGARASRPATAQRPACTGTIREQPSADPPGTARACVLADGTEHGPYEVVDAAGLVLLDGTMERGARTGTWTRRRPDGTRRDETTWVAGVKEGREALYDARGEREAEGAHAAGKRHGTWNEYAPNGMRTRESTWVAGVKEGHETQWDEDGRKLRSGPYVAGKEHGLWTTYHPRGPKASQGQMVHGEPTGTWARWSEDGRRDNSIEYRGGEAVMLNDAPTCPPGTIRVERDQGQGGEQWCEGTRRGRRGNEVVREGPYARYGATGQLMETGEFKGGERNGVWQTMDASGAPAMETTYNEGRVVAQKRIRR